MTSSYNAIPFDNPELYSYLDLCHFLVDFYVLKDLINQKKNNLD